ncbi:MAG TPA: hypothetical protein PLR06_03865 [Cyclobacteriaceae bacterium]|nr:hypothetical protein [Cyclobacteriaceae bacterium]
MNLTKILTVVLLAASLYLGYFLYSGVQQVIDDRVKIEESEAIVIERLKLIREAESVYQEQFRKYTSSWDTLARFIETGRVPILQRREELKQKAYGGEEVIVHIDTLGFVSAKDRIFKKEYTMNASDNGTFMGFKVKVGDQVVKNMKAYSIKVGKDVKEPPFQENGRITELTDVKVGQDLTKGTVLIKYWNYIFNPNVDIAKIGEVPGNPGVNFSIITKRIDRNGLFVDVIEVVDPKPFNKSRKESNEQKSRKPLRFGSLTDVSTAGNWE